MDLTMEIDQPLTQSAEAARVMIMTSVSGVRRAPKSIIKTETHRQPSEEPECELLKRIVKPRVSTVVHLLTEQATMSSDLQLPLQRKVKPDLPIRKHKWVLMKVM